MTMLPSENIMRAFYILTCLIIGIYGRYPCYKDEVEQRLTEIGRRCVLESSANEDDIEEIKALMFPTRREGKCLLSCIQKVIGVQVTEDGKFTMEKPATTILKYLQEVKPSLYEKVVEIGLRCGPNVYAMQLKDPCDLADEMVSCGMKEGITNSDKHTVAAFILNV